MAKDGRYSRLELLGWKRTVLADMRVIVMGAGALGNEAVKNLALLGVGHVIVVDMDRIETSNLTRSVLFRETDLGEYKAQVAAARAAEIDPSTNAIAVVGEFQRSVGLGTVRQADVVLGCLDNFRARIDANRLCLEAGTLYIDGGLRGLDGDVKAFGPPFDVCFDCILNASARKSAWKRYSCLDLLEESTEVGPTAPTIAAIIAGLQVQLAVKYVHGYSIPIGHRISFSGVADEFSKVKLHRNIDCPTHALAKSLDELPLVRLDYTELMPMQEVMDRLAALEQLGEFQDTRLGYDLVVGLECGRCGYATPLFRRAGFVRVAEARCPRCVEQGVPEQDSIMHQTLVNTLDGSEPFLGLTAYELDFPPVSILEARGSRGSVFVELFDQERAIFHDEHGTATP